MAGGVYGKINRSYYLYTGQFYWTMSPSRFTSSGYAYVFYVYSNGNLSNNSVGWTAPGVRPVISLTTNNTITGSGTISDPYIVN